MKKIKQKKRKRRESGRETGKYFIREGEKYKRRRKMDDSCIDKDRSIETCDTFELGNWAKAQVA